MRRDEEGRGEEGRWGREMRRGGEEDGHWRI